VDQMSIVQYQFPSRPGATEYCLFPRELEKDGLILFHATSAKNAPDIIKDGFKIPDPSGENGLASVSFAKRSVSALTHAMSKRHAEPGDWVVFAVQYRSLDREGLVNNLCDINDFTLTPSPLIVGYCTVPASYEHV